MNEYSSIFIQVDGKTFILFPLTGILTLRFRVTINYLENYRIGDCY